MSGGTTKILAGPSHLAQAAGQVPALTAAAP
jgi:hypothetical protein